MVSLPGVAFGRKESAILRKIVDSVSLVRKTEQGLPELVAEVAGGDIAACSAKRAAIFELESRAAVLHREVSREIAEGAFFGGVREDMLNLIGLTYEIADRTKDAARLLTLARVTDARAIEVLQSEDMRQFLANLDKAVVALKELIESFAVSKKAVLERVHVVEDYEEAADVSKNNMLMAIFDKSRGSIDPVTLLLVKDFLFCADDVADRAEDASDVALVLVAKGYG